MRRVSLFVVLYNVVVVGRGEGGGWLEGGALRKGRGGADMSGEQCMKEPSVGPLSHCPAVPLLSLPFCTL